MDENRMIVDRFVGPKAKTAFLACAELLEASLEYSGGCWTLNELWRDVELGNKVLFVAVDSEDDEVVGAMLGAAQTLGGVKELHMEFAAGKLFAFDAALPLIEDWARELGCERVRATGRKGWVRALKKHGYGELWTSVSKTLRSIH